VVALGVMIGLSLPVLFQPSPQQMPQASPKPVVRKALPPPPAETPAFLKAEGSEAKARSLLNGEGNLPSPDATPASPPTASAQPVVPPAHSDAASPSVTVDTSAPASGPPQEALAEPKEMAEPPKAEAPKAVGRPSARSPGREKSAPPKEGAVRFAFTVHVESYSSREAAQTRVDALRGQGLDAFSNPADIPGKGLYHRVFVGKFPDKAQALAYQKRLHGERGLSGGRVMAAAELSR
jgi:cell division septation protein DedD